LNSQVCIPVFNSEPGPELNSQVCIPVFNSNPQRARAEFASVYSGLQLKPTKGQSWIRKCVFRSSAQTHGLSGRETVFVQCKFG